MRARHTHVGMLALALAALVATLVAVVPGVAGAADPPPTIDVVSNRADLLSAGDARIAIRVPAGTDPADVTVRIGDRDVSDQFAWRPNGAFEGLVEGIEVGVHQVTATVGGAALAPVTITMHPNGGPVFSGPQVGPWRCQSSAVDEQCNQPATYQLQYRTTSGSWSSYDPDNPPSNVATTTTDEGHTVPFIVRVETGYQNRDQYRVAVLYDPHADDAWEAWSPQEQWNHKLLINHGASCGTTYSAGSAPDVMNATALGRGFMVMSTALNNAGHNCNVITQAESMVMAKERIVERYGDIRYTIGTGCSGGALAQQQVANAYPGIYQGILPACSFPDAWSTGQHLIDAYGANRYFHDPTRWGLGVIWDPLSIAAVEGHPNHVNAVIFETIYWQALGNPTSGCTDVPADQRYHPTNNPSGVRCTLMDYMINVFGPRPQEVWSPMEEAAGHGFAGIPLDNVGVQYGLQALMDGRITTTQFIDLNVKAGGGDIDTNFAPERLEADPVVLERAYRSGAINTASNLDQVAIIDLRGPDHGIFHDAYRTWAVRARLEREHGHFDNHVIWFGHVPLMGDPRFMDEALLAMDRWLAAVEADDSDAPLAERIVANRPADIQDRCSQIPGVDLIELPGVGRVCEHEHLQSRYATPRMVAGSGVETDIMKCTLKAHRRQDYYPVSFTDAQWAALDAVFPSGVCDFAKPGIGQRDTVPWQTYQDGPVGEVTFGGTSLGVAPAGSGTGWTSPAFDAWLQADGTVTDPGPGDPDPGDPDPDPDRPGKGNNPGKGKGPGNHPGQGDGPGGSPGEGQGQRTDVLTGPQTGSAATAMSGPADAAVEQESWWQRLLAWLFG